MNDAKLVLLYSQREIPDHHKRQWTFRYGHRYKIGRCAGEKPDVDLSFDLSITRTCHAEIFYENAGWRIRDTSRWGTRVNGESLCERDGVALKEEDRITIGNETTLVFFPYRWHCAFRKGFFIGMDAADSLNYSLLFNRQPFIEKISIINCEKNPSAPSSLCLELGGYFCNTFQIPALNTGAYYMAKPCIAPDKDLFENRSGRSFSALTICLDGHTVLEKEITIYGCNEWSKENNPAHRISLASFVIPKQFAVQQAVAEIEEYPDDHDDNTEMSPETLLQNVYNYFKTKWKIRYSGEPVSPERGFQEIAFPSHVLADRENRIGTANCLDISVLFASCLERTGGTSGTSPLLLVFRMNTNLWHAIVGCWKKRKILENPVIEDKLFIEENAVIIDPTLACNGYDAGFKEALEKGSGILHESELVFALDIATARQCGIAPLPFNGDPIKSKRVDDIENRAKQLADEFGEKTRYKVYTPLHLLLVMMTDHDGYAQKLFAQEEIDIDRAMKEITNKLESYTPPQGEEVLDLKPSEHYNIAWTIASRKAKEEDSPFVFEQHLFIALLESGSKSIQSAITNILKTNPDRLKKLAESENSNIKISHIF